MDVLCPACKSADGLFEALLEPMSRSVHKPGKQDLDAAAAASHNLVQILYSVLLLHKGHTDQIEPPGSSFWHAGSGKATTAHRFILLS